MTEETAKEIVSKAKEVSSADEFFEGLMHLPVEEYDMFVDIWYDTL
jgi:CRISPR/Cas system-associated protein Csm6